MKITYIKIQKSSNSLELSIKKIELPLISHLNNHPPQKQPRLQETQQVKVSKWKRWEFLKTQHHMPSLLMMDQTS